MSEENKRNVQTFAEILKYNDYVTISRTCKEMFFTASVASCAFGILYALAERDFSKRLKAGCELYESIYGEE